MALETLEEPEETPKLANALCGSTRPSPDAEHRPAPNS